MARSNPFPGYLDDSTIDLIHVRAALFGFRRDEWPEIEQDLAMEIAAFVYDPARGSKRTALIALIDRRLKMRIRSRCRREQRQGIYDRLHRRLEATNDVEDPHLETDRAVDVQAAISGLSKSDQWVCRELMEGVSRRTIFKELGESRYDFDRRLDRIREHFVEIGLQAWLFGRRSLS